MTGLKQEIKNEKYPEHQPDCPYNIVQAESGNPERMETDSENMIALAKL